MSRHCHCLCHSAGKMFKNLYIWCNITWIWRVHAWEHNFLTKLIIQIFCWPGTTRPVQGTNNVVSSTGHARARITLSWWLTVKGWTSKTWPLSFRLSLSLCRHDMIWSEMNCNVALSLPCDNPLPSAAVPYSLGCHLPPGAALGPQLPLWCGLAAAVRPRPRPL